jgi:CheY-like chemotaxis protein
MMGGEIEVHSAPGEGSRFAFELRFALQPEAASSPASGPAPVSAQAQPGSLRGAHLLLVEDNAINREIAEALLEGEGVTLSVACNGQEALDLLEHERYDGVLMDCEMPVLDGYEATRRLRRRPDCQALPVIAMTASALEGDREKALAAGMNDHIVKPIDVDDMLATLARWVRPLSPPRDRD